MNSVVVTNNGKNSKNWLKLLSRTVQRNSSTTQVVGEGTAESLDWMKNLRGKDNDKFVGSRGDWWYTGKSPEDALKNVPLLSQNSSHLSAIPQVTLKDITEEKLRNYFDNSWLQTEVLFASLNSEEAFYRPPYHNLRHPMIFYYGHPATFYTNKLRVAGLVDKGIDPYFEEIFEVGVDEMRWDDISTIAKDWPEILDVHEYRKKSYKLVTDMLSEQFEKQKKHNINWKTPLWSMVMAIEHEKIHLETSSVLMRELPKYLLHKADSFPTYHKAAKIETKNYRPTVSTDFPQNKLIKVVGGEVKLGKTSEADKMTYGWDNEFGSRVIEVPDFEVSKFKVSNGEYFEFVKSGGYREQKYWSEDGWGWRVFRNQKQPTFWKPEGPAGSYDYALRTIFDEIPMQWSWPVCVNYHEATAFCAWKSEQTGLAKDKGLRLITEAEFHRMWDEDQQLPLSDISKDISVSNCGTEDYNNHLTNGSEGPVDFHKPNSKGIYDVFGNTWDWSEDDFNSFPGYEVHPYYDDFSSPCFDGAHKMIFGGSFISSCDNGGNLFSRYSFRPHFHQHAGFRYIKPSQSESSIKGQNVATFIGPEKAHFSAIEQTTKSNKATTVSFETNTYETEQLLDQYVALHFGQSPTNVDSTIIKHQSRPDHALQFAQRSADLLTSVFKKNNPNSETTKLRALDVGCAVGGASFQLAETFGEVWGMDFSVAFVKKADEIKNLAENEELQFQVPVSGQLYRKNIFAALPPKAAREKSHFVAGDATKLNELKLGQFDAVLCANLICRLPEPLDLLNDLETCVNKNGIVLFLSPYSWLEEFTPKSKWLQQGNEEAAIKLKNEMSKRGFVLVHEEEVPLVIREHERKYQYIVSNGLAFRKI